MSSPLLDALSQVITVSGGLAEFPQENRLEAALSQEAAHILGVSDSVAFSTLATQSDCTLVSYHSDIFQRCETLLANQGRFVSFAVDYSGYLKQSGFEKLISSTLIPQNGLLRIGLSTPAWTPYCRFNVAYTASASDKRLGLISFWLNGLTQVPGVSVGDALFWDSDFIPTPDDLQLDPTPLMPLVEHIAHQSISEELSPWCQSLQRKLDRDQRRLTDYYQTIIQEIQHKCQKKNLAGEALDKELSRIDATQLELQSKLKDIQQRSALTISAEVHSLLVVWLRTVHTEVELVRKKQKRHLIAIYNPYTQIIEPWRCQLTNLPVTKFFLDPQMNICRDNIDQA